MYMHIYIYIERERFPCLRSPGPSTTTPRRTMAATTTNNNSIHNNYNNYNNNHNNHINNEHVDMNDNNTNANHYNDNTTNNEHYNDTITNTSDNTSFNNTSNQLVMIRLGVPLRGRHRRLAGLHLNMSTIEPGCCNRVAHHQSLVDLQCIQMIYLGRISM